MEPRVQLGEAAKRIRRLIEASAAPARREEAKISQAAPKLKQRRADLAAAAQAALLKEARIGWIPFFGTSAKAAARTAQAESEAAAKEWTSLIARARRANDALGEAKAAVASVARLEARGKVAPEIPDHTATRLAALLVRVRFLEEGDAKETSKAAQMKPKVLLLAQEAADIAENWGLAYRPKTVAAEPAPYNRPVEIAKKGRAAQLGLDFDGTGQIEAEPRIWLPVSASRAREMVERGARLDRDSSRRGSQLWIPASEATKFAPFLPLAFRTAGVKLSFPPIRHNAVGQNLWSVFDADSWNHIRTAAYDRSGHRCQLCGKQGGNLWQRLAAPEERKKGGPVDCHEVWDWQPSKDDARVGIQKLQRLLIVCKDCHMIFHNDFAMFKAREAGIEGQAAQYLETLRMLINRQDRASLAAQMAGDRADWDSNKSVDKWVLDLSHLAQQDFMADHTLVLKDNNKANVGPDQIGGIAFVTEDGTAFAAQDASALEGGEPPRILSGGGARTYR